MRSSLPLTTCPSLHSVWTSPSLFASATLHHRKRLVLGGGGGGKAMHSHLASERAGHRGGKGEPHGSLPAPLLCSALLPSLKCIFGGVSQCHPLACMCSHTQTFCCSLSFHQTLSLPKVPNYNQATQTHTHTRTLSGISAL